MDFNIIIDGQYLKGFDGEPTGSSTSHMGYHPQAVEMHDVELASEKSEALTVGGFINLKSYLDRINDRIRYTDFKFNEMTIKRVD